MNGQCYKCPKYCNGCINENECIEGGKDRIAGICTNNTFDDGYECLKDFSYEIKEKKNKVYYYGPILNKDYDPTCL